MELHVIGSFFLLIHLAATNNDAVNISVTCSATKDEKPTEWYERSRSNPSMIHHFTVQLSNGSSAFPAMNISWTINIDSSVHSITGTWIEPNMNDPDHLRYRCEYQPPFSSKQINYTGLEKLHFHFTTTDLPIEPNETYQVRVYNLPPPGPPINAQFSKSQDFQAPGCDHKKMKSSSSCSNKRQNLTNGSGSQSDDGKLSISAIHTENEIQVIFKSQSSSDKYEIRLRKKTAILNGAEEQTNGEIKTIRVKLNYSGTCEDLEIWITPHLKHCGFLCKSVLHKVDCKNVSPSLIPEEPKKQGSSFSIIIGCAVAVVFMLVCFLCFWRFHLQSGRSRHHLDSSSAGPLGVLVVYPAVNKVFQHAVMVLADFLQSHRGVKIAIDMWQKGSLAEQGPLRWLNSQVDQADVVIIVLPPQHKRTGNASTDGPPTILPGRTYYTVPASAQDLFSLAMNLVAGCAHDSQSSRKFYVVHIGGGLQRSTVPLELRGCKALFLPKDLKKLHEKLFYRQRVLNSGLSCNFRSCHCHKASKKVRRVMLELGRSLYFEDESINLTEVENS